MKLTKTYVEGALEVKPGVWLVEDAVITVGDVADPTTEIPIRTDLPMDHPLYGRRAVSRVVAGMPDIEATKTELVLDPLSTEPVPFETIEVK